MMNVCSQINCPFANTNPAPPRSSGCTRYSISNHCHLMSHDKGFRSELRPNQYWLFAELDSAKIEEIKQCNDAFIQADESSQRKMKWEKI